MINDTEICLPTVYKITVYDEQVLFVYVLQ